MKPLDEMPKRRRGGSYPWDEWFAALPCEIERGVDYDVDDVVMRSMIYARATRLGMKVRTSATDSGLAIGVAE